MYKQLLKILGLISCLFAIITTWLFDFVSQYLPGMPPKIWLSLILLIFLLLLFFKTSPKKETKTIVKFVLKWDNTKNPYCQKCDAILTNFINPKTNSLMPNPYFKCHKCEHKNYLIDESGKILTFEEAKKLL